MFLLLIFGLVGHWDYEDALLIEHAAAQATTRTLMCEEKADNTMHERRQVDPHMITVADHGLMNQPKKLSS